MMISVLNMVFKTVTVLMMALIFCSYNPGKGMAAEAQSDVNYRFEKAEFEKIINDDMNFAGLAEAVKLSAEYYRNQPDEGFIMFNSRQFSFSEMAAAGILFSEIVSRYKGRQLSRMLSANFEVFRYSSDSRVLFTGYYNLKLNGSSRKTAYYNVPVYRRPDDLVTVDLKLFGGPESVISGKLHQGNLVPYDTREYIVSRESLKNRSEAICYLNIVDLFFLQTEGSGTVMLETGNHIHLNADVSNGHDFISIGKFLDPGVPLDPESFRNYFKSSPKKAEILMNRNPRYVFFKETDSGPVGNTGLMLTAGRSAAADNSVYPNGIILYFKADSGNAIQRFAVVQDSGSAITGSGRIDLFFGSSSEQIHAGENFRSQGDLFIILPSSEKKSKK